MVLPARFVLGTILVLTCVKDNMAATALIKRNIGGPSPDAYVPFIEKAVLAIPEERFAGDPTLVQSVDSVNSKTYYQKADDRGHLKTLLQRDSVDSEKPVVVLSYERSDNGPHKKSRRVYIALRQTSKDKNTYYATYAYVRQFLSNDDPAEKFEVNGEALRVEWDTWSSRDKNNMRARSFGFGGDLDYSTEFQADIAGIKDVGGGVKKADVGDLSWGLNVNAAGSVGGSSFVGSNAGKAGWGSAGVIDAGAMIDVGGDFGDGDFDFFDDLDDAGGSHGRTITSIMAFMTNDPLDAFAQHKDDPFAGVGHCPHVHQTAESIDSITDPKSAATIYLSALGTQCSLKYVNRILRLFQKGHLTINGDKSLSIPSKCPLMRTSKLTKDEARHLTAAFEFSMISQVFASEIRHPSSSLTAPDGSHIPRAVYAIIRFALHALKKAKAEAPAHVILITRRLLKTLKSMSTKIWQHHKKLGRCTACSQQDRDDSYSSVLNLQAIQQFIVADFAEILSGEDLVSTYAAFYNTHKQFIYAKAKPFLQQ